LLGFFQSDPQILVALGQVARPFAQSRQLPLRRQQVPAEVLSFLSQRDHARAELVFFRAQQRAQKVVLLFINPFGALPAAREFLKFFLQALRLPEHFFQREFPIAFGDAADGPKNFRQLFLGRLKDRGPFETFLFHGRHAPGRLTRE
jgi:hypothetical protein